MPAAALAVAVLTGCGADPAPAAAPAATDKAPASADPQGKRRQMEAMRADCMKGKGFKYEPYVPPPAKVSEESRREWTGDYATMREQRERRGFRIYFPFVHPEDPEDGIGTVDPNPNDALAGSLSRTQYRAWDAADGACYAEAFTELTGKTVTSKDDVFTQAENMYLRTTSRELDGDPRMIELATAFGTCLKGKGYPVPSLKPTALNFSSRERLEKQRGDVIAGRVKQDPEDTGFRRLTPQEAKPYLVKEIKVSLDDLECGKDFYAAFLPRYEALRQKAYREFGEDDGLWS
ncbi:hypothetical protein GCM10023075_15830 [Streptosporangium album]